MQTSTVLSSVILTPLTAWCSTNSALVGSKNVLPMANLFRASALWDWAFPPSRAGGKNRCLASARILKSKKVRPITCFGGKGRTASVVKRPAPPGFVRDKWCFCISLDQKWLMWKGESHLMPFCILHKMGTWEGNRTPATSRHPLDEKGELWGGVTAGGKPV